MSDVPPPPWAGVLFGARLGLLLAGACSMHL